MYRTVTGAVGALLVALVTLLAGAMPSANAGHLPPVGGPEPALPVVFVHGANGSAAQYETQALRWASNNYPNLVTAIDRTSSLSITFYPQLDAFLDNVLAQTGSPKVYLVGHSLGTSLSAGYLNSSPARAARVAKYIGIDGATSAGCPGGINPDTGEWNVPCMGIWGRGSLTRQVGPDHNVYLSEQGHTESVGSAESFVAQYRFFTGQEPATTRVLPQPPGEVEVAGRALNYPANTGINGATVQLWEVNPKTGVRKNAAPDQEVVLDATGNWGPWPVNGQQRYEITVIRQSDDGPRYQHFYYEPWIRSNYLVRLNLSPFGSTLANAIAQHSGPHTVVSVVRQKEWWGNNTVDPSNVDTLNISTARPGGVVDAGDVATAGTAPYSASTIAMIIFDINADGVTNTASLTNLGAFLSGVDVYMPANDPPDGTITFAHQQRRMAHEQVIHTPNWSQQAGHGMTVTFRDWTQDITTWGQCMSARPSPCR